MKIAQNRLLKGKKREKVFQNQKKKYSKTILNQSTQTTSEKVRKKKTLRT